MIIYKGREMTIKEACKLMGIDRDDFMAWCKNFNWDFILMIKTCKQCQDVSGVM